MRRAVYPLAVGSQAVPIPVIGVLLAFWWGFGIFPKLVVVALICFFPVLVTTVDGLAAVDPDRVFYDAAAEGIAYTRGEVFHFDGRGTDCLALSFANLTPPRIADGVALFAAVVRR